MRWRKYRSTVLFSIFTILAAAFIFSNSFKSGPESLSQSNLVVKWVRAIIDPHERIPYETLSFFVRKAAHMTEFALLGISLGGLSESIAGLRGKNTPFLAPFLSLLAAVSDEFIQSFTGRGSQVSDVLIDFSGALLGMLLVWIVLMIRRKKQRRYGR